MGGNKRGHKLAKSGCGLLLCLFLVLASGCWDRRELEKLAVVLTMGLDLAAQGSDYKVSFQIVRAGQLQSPGASGPASSGGDGGSKPIWILQSTGPTLFEAIRNANFQSSRRPFLSHNQVLIFGERLARQGLFPVLDFLVRDHEPRNTQWLLLTPDDPAAVLDAAAGLELVSAVAIADLIQDFHLTSQIKPVRLFEYVETMRSRTTANVLPIIKTKETAGKKELVIDGTAIIKDDRLIGTLDRKETRGLLWVLGEVQGGVITVDLPDGGKATFEIFNASTKVKVGFAEGTVHAKIEVKANVGLGNQTTHADLTTPGQTKKVQALQAGVIAREIRAALAKAKEYKADIFGFGEYLYKHDHKTWQRLYQDWDRYFTGVEVEIEVAVMVEQLGLVNRSVIF